MRKRLLRSQIGLSTSRSTEAAELPSVEASSLCGDEDVSTPIQPLWRRGRLHHNSAFVATRRLHPEII
jgi:hypothetical protein